MLHGRFGEDGTVQGLLETLDVPYVGAGVAASAVCMDKVLFKELMAAAGTVPQVDYVDVREERCAGAERQELLEQVMRARPAGVRQARAPRLVGGHRQGDDAEDELEDALEAAFAHDALAIVEAMARGIEVECGVLGSSRGERGDGAPALASSRARSCFAGDFYDFEAKYAPGGMELLVPARISDAAPPRGCASSRCEAFARAGCDGLARVDFFVDGEQRAAERAEHDAGVHADERVREADGGVGGRVSGARRPALPAGAGAARGACIAGVLRATRTDGRREGRAGRAGCALAGGEHKEGWRGVLAYASR